MDAVSSTAERRGKGVRESSHGGDDDSGAEQFLKMCRARLQWHSPVIPAARRCRQEAHRS